METPSFIEAPPAIVFAGSPGEPSDDLRGRAAGKRQAKRENSTCDVLLVEDEAETRDAMLEMLTLEGYEASGAANGLEALSLLENGAKPSLILLDLLMPAMDGWEFCRELAARPALAEIPIAIVSATGQERLLPERKINAGHFRKPFDLVRLLNTIQKYCA